MIDLQIGGLYIDRDEYQFILGKPCKRKQKDKDGNVVEVDAFDSYGGFYPTLGSALNGAYKKLQREVVGSRLMTLQEALQASLEIEQRLLFAGEANGLRANGAGKTV